MNTYRNPNNQPSYTYICPKIYSSKCWPFEKKLHDQQASSDIPTSNMPKMSHDKEASLALFPSAHDKGTFFCDLPLNISQDTGTL